MAIKFGDIAYFTLLDLEQKLKAFKYDKLDLICLDKLRNEVDTKIKQINFEHNNQRAENNPLKQ